MTAAKSYSQAAIATAMNYITDLSDVLPAKRLRLEEIDQNTSGNWLITVSFIDSDTFESRVYKLMEIDQYGKQVLSMKIRELTQAST